MVASKDEAASGFWVRVEHVEYIMTDNQENPIQERIWAVNTCGFFDSAQEAKKYVEKERRERANNVS